MKTIGLIGGMSWESTALYYRIINETVKEQLGGLHSARCLLYSVDFQEVETCQAAGDWDRAEGILCGAAESLEKGGADFFIICTNTMHKLAPGIQRAVAMPLLHIADLTAQELAAQGIRMVGLLGTRYTMEQTFYTERLEAAGIQVIIPNDAERKTVHDVIYQELCRGIVSEDSRREYLQISENLQARGAEGVILGCTEIGMLLKQSDTRVPLFDTTHIHARQAALYSLGTS